MSLHKKLQHIFSAEKDVQETRYINIQLLCKSLWKTNLFNFIIDVTDKIPINFWISKNTVVVYSNHKTFLDGNYCDLILANKILKFLVTEKKIVLPVFWKELNTILPYFAIEYIEKGITETKKPIFVPSKFFSQATYFDNTLGAVEIFPNYESIRILLRFVQKINFYDPIQFLKIIYPKMLDDKGNPLFIDINSKETFNTILMAKQNLIFPDKPDNIGLNCKNILMDSFVFQKLISFFGTNSIPTHTTNYSHKYNFASYRKIKFNLMDAPSFLTSVEHLNIFTQGRRNINRLKLKRKVPEPVNKIEDISIIPIELKANKIIDEKVLLRSKPKDLTPAQIKTRRSIMNRNRYQESKKDDISVLDNKTYTIKNNDIHNINDSYILATSHMYLSHKQQKLRTN